MTSRNEQPVLEADPNINDDFEYASDYGSGRESDLTSLVTAAKNHVFENGRRYHGYKEVRFFETLFLKAWDNILCFYKGKYFFPNDENEQERMDILHHCCLLALRGELFVAPVGKDWKPQRVLDVGTGTGIWAIDFAE